MAETAKKRTTRKKKVEPASRGLTPKQAADQAPPAAIAKLEEQVVADGGTVVGSFRDPLGGHWQTFVVLPVDKVAPTPFQRDLSDAHAKRLCDRIGELDRFLDPIVVVRAEDGTYHTPNGHHRLAAVRELGGRSITGLLVPEAEMAYRILSLNTEKAHNLREKALEVIRMARGLAELDPAPERDFAEIFEEPALLTLGACYEKRGRFSGSVYQPVLKRTEAFLESRMPRALEVREERAQRLLDLDDAVVAAVKELKAKGIDSPYLKNFVVARINPLRFKRGADEADFDETLDKMLASAKKLDAAKVKVGDLAKTGGPLDD